MNRPRTGASFREQIPNYKFDSDAPNSGVQVCADQGAVWLKVWNWTGDAVEIPLGERQVSAISRSLLNAQASVDLHEWLDGDGLEYDDDDLA